jgi:hypothetical protein
MRNISGKSLSLIVYGFGSPGNDFGLTGFGIGSGSAPLFSPMGCGLGSPGNIFVSTGFGMGSGNAPFFFPIGSGIGSGKASRFPT